MTRREELKAALAKAEATLVDAVTGAAKADGDRADANADIEKQRDYCRRLHAALIELSRVGPTARLREELDIQIRQLLEASKRMPDRSPPSRQSSSHRVRGKNNHASRDESGRREPVRRFKTGILALKLHSRSALSRHSFIRQAIGLFALILAFLEYFHIDVQLQIARLPSVFG